MFGKPRIVFTDQSKSEFGGVFDRGCVTMDIKHSLSAVSRGQSNAVIERVHRELAICIFAELKERGMSSSEWPSVFNLCIDKLNRRSHINGKPSAFELVNGDKPYFSSVEFLKSLVENDSTNNVPVFKRNEEVLFFNPNRTRAKIEGRFEPMIVEKHLSKHTVLLRASCNNKFRLPTYRVIAHPGQIKRKIDININPLSNPTVEEDKHNKNLSKNVIDNEDSNDDSLSNSDVQNENNKFSKVKINLIQENEFIIWNVKEQNKLCIGKIVSIDKDEKLCDVHYFGTYSVSSNLSERIFRPSWQSPQGWCIFQNKCPKLFIPELISVCFDDILDIGFKLHNNRLPSHLANKYMEVFDSFSFFSSEYESYDLFGKVRKYPDVLLCNENDFKDLIKDANRNSGVHAYANVSLMPVKINELNDEERILLKKAQEKEFDAYKRNNVYELVPFSQATTKPIPSSMRNCKKLISDANAKVPVYKFKSRLVISGTEKNDSREDLDVTTAMPPMEAFRAFLSVASRKKNFKPSDIQQADVVTAFLQAYLNTDKPVFVYPPREHPDYGKGVWRMLKAGNGLRDSPRSWFLHSDAILLKLGWEHTIFDGVYIRKKNNLIDGVLLLWVDDILVLDSLLPLCV